MTKRSPASKVISRGSWVVLASMLLAACGGAAAPASSPPAPPASPSAVAKPSSAAPAVSAQPSSAAPKPSVSLSASASAKPAAAKPAASAAPKPSGARPPACPAAPASAGAAPAALGAALRPTVTIDIPGVSLNPGAGRSAGLSSTIQPGGLSTDFIRYDAASHLMYLADGANLGVDVFDTSAKKMIERIPTPSAPHDMIFDDSLHLMLAALSSKKIAVIDLNTGKQSLVDVGGTSIADLMGYDPASKLVVVGSKGITQLSFLHVDPAGTKVVKKLPLGKDNPEEPVFYNGKFYLSVCNQIAVVDPTSMTITTRQDVPGCEGHGFAMGPAPEAYLGCTTGGDIVNLDTGKVVAAFDGSQVGDTDQPAYDATKKRYYAPGHVTRNGVDVAVMGVIDATTHKLISTRTTDPGSQTQAAVDSSGTVYIATGPAVHGACLSACLFGYQP